jgi:ATP-dependent Zn protease
VKSDQALTDQLAKGFQNVRITTHLITKEHPIDTLVRSLLPSSSSLNVVDSARNLKHLPPCDLVLIDVLGWSGKEPFPFEPGLDQQVVRYLVYSDVAKNAEPWLRAQFLTVRGFHPGIMAPRQSAMGKVLLEAFDLARFSKLFETCRMSHLRWKTHLELATDPESGSLMATLCFDGEERVLDARDLKKDLPWCEVPVLRFDDVLGLRSTKARLLDYVTWLRNPNGEPGLQACVLSGPPGTGKTHACLAAAGEAGVPCMIVGGSEFATMWCGESERIIRETFASLLRYDSAVLVVDEFDAIAWRRDTSNAWRAESQASIVGQLLRSIDLLRKGPGRILLLATTNQYDRIDSAVVRSMRMGDHIHFGLPTAADRRDIIQGLCNGLLDEVDLDAAVNFTTGLSPADLTRVMAGARKQVESLPGVPFIGRLLETVFELRRGEADQALTMDEPTKRRVATHEAGHALLSFHLLGKDSLQHVSIGPTASGLLGATYRQPPEKVEILDRSAVESHLAVLMAGRTAEALMDPSSGPSSGAEGDLQEATRLAQMAVGNWGLDSEFPALSLGALQPGLQAVLAPQVLKQIGRWLQMAEAKARTVLIEHRLQLDQLTHRLLVVETLHRQELVALLEVPKACTQDAID